MKKLGNKLLEVSWIKKTADFFKREKVRKTLSVINKIKNGICWTIFILLILLVVVLVTTRINGNTPSLFGYSMCRVTTGSMEPELMVGDIIINKTVDDVNTLKVDDVVTYQGSGSTEGMLVTHKIIVAPHKNEHGIIVLQTQGVANDAADAEFSAERVVGVMITKVPVLSELFSLFLTPWGLLIFILALIIIFLDEFVNLIKALAGYMPKEEPENISEIIDRLQKEENEKKLKENHTDADRPDDEL